MIYSIRYVSSNGGRLPRTFSNCQHVWCCPLHNRRSSFCTWATRIIGTWWWGRSVNNNQTIDQSDHHDEWSSERKEDEYIYTFWSWWINNKPNHLFCVLSIQASLVDSLILKRVMKLLSSLSCIFQRSMYFATWQELKQITFDYCTIRFKYSVVKIVNFLLLIRMFLLIIPSCKPPLFLWITINTKF